VINCYDPVSLIRIDRPTSCDRLSYSLYSGSSTPQTPPVIDLGLCSYFFMSQYDAKHSKTKYSNCFNISREDAKKREFYDQIYYYVLKATPTVSGSYTYA
jgi:hypothetical protein